MQPPKPRPARMHPVHGGEPLRRPPIVGHIHDKEYEARKYMEYLAEELADDEHPKWSGSQRAYLKRQHALWLTRTMGLDAHYVKHGTFRRPFNAEPPGMAEIIQEEWRRREEDRTGVKVSAAAERRRWKISAPHQLKKIVKRLQKKHGTGTVYPQED